MIVLKILVVFVILRVSKTVKVRVEQGLLEGTSESSVLDGKRYYCFKGIPYAKPPLGNLRFKDPQAPEPWKGTRKASQHGPKCIQYNIYEEKNVPGSEDCLTLNVYSPCIDATKRLPVMFFIHGGRFQSESGDDDFYGPDIFVSFDMVLVTINYRLEVLGFLKLDISEVSGNAGMKDQVAALKWVRKNIHKFGGDPDNVTILGQSSGGASVGYHMISPMSRGLFNRAIAMSGVPFCDWVEPFHVKRKSFILGEQLGLKTKDPWKLLDFLQNVPAERLLNVNTSAVITEYKTYPFKASHFVPTTEINFGQKVFLTEDPFTALKKGNVNEVDLMLGYTNIELLVNLDSDDQKLFTEYTNHSDMFVPVKILHRVTPDKILQAADQIIDYYFQNKQITPKHMKDMVQYFTKSTFEYDVYRFMKYLPNTRKKYLYVFSCQSNRNILGNKASKKYGINGTVHRDDLNYLFQPKKNNPPIDRNNIHHIIKVGFLFTNFAKFGNPTPFDSLWQQFDEHTRNYLEIGNQLKPGTFNTTDVKFWESIFQQAGVEF